ncbi:His/Gly/Thr/Pro-type tRNA ligase C-terminal domain-containing protein, partial [Stenotrophomonas maltophilia]|uniref:His/Gly/Thr/Pro-type tRNA ligase C-terminal domain-containing protein n=1 Tax=Stenotrophomonas maltophilia TaxID=40324 RepID=UPI003144D6AF
EHTLQRVPYLLVIGDRETENGAVAVRTRSGEDLGRMSLQAFIERLHAEGAYAKVRSGRTGTRTGSIPLG